MHFLARGIRQVLLLLLLFCSQKANHGLTALQLVYNSYQSELIKVSCQISKK